MTTVKPETVSIYQVKKTEKDTYKKRTNWRLKDLKLIDGRDETNVSIAQLIRAPPMGRIKLCKCFFMTENIPQYYY